MKAIKVIIGLLVDDVRLATVLVIALILAWLAEIAGQPLVGGILLWLGLIVSLWISIEHQLTLKTKKP